MREEVRSSSAAPPDRPASPPPTTVASSAGPSSPPGQTNVATIDWLGGDQVSKVGCSHVAPDACQPSLSTNAVGIAVDSFQPSCRPWERGDLLRRLATFKTSMWDCKPKAASSLACARRGWVNIEMDKIECESCGAHLIFTALASWTPAEVANAGEAFAEQLDASHQNDCPWRGNSCADSLVQFHLTSSALVGGFKDRCDGLLQFASLPVIAQAAIDSMKLTRGAEIDHVLSHPVGVLSGELGYKTGSTTGIDINHQDGICGYSQAQKLISLCGWEARWLPNVQDLEENSTRSAINAGSTEPKDVFWSQISERQNSCSASIKKEKRKGKMRVKDTGCSMRSPLLDCNLCGATARFWDFKSVPRPSHFSLSKIDAPETGRKPVLTRGISVTSGINEGLAEGVERDNIEWRDESRTDDKKSLSNAQLDLNLTMAGGLPSKHSALPPMPEHFNFGGMGKDLMIGQPTGSEFGGHATSFESRGPSSRKRYMEEGGSTADKPINRLQPADSIEGTVIDRDGDEVDDAAQDSGTRSKRHCGLNLFDVNCPSSSGAGPSRNLSFNLDIDADRFDASKAEIPSTLQNPSTRDSMRASSVIAMDIVHNVESNSMESVEYHPRDGDDVSKPSSSSARRSAGMSDTLDLNYSNQEQQNNFVQPATESNAREIEGSSMNAGEEVLNAEIAPAFTKDQLSVGVSGGSVGMGASHEAEIHGIDVSEHKTCSVVGDADPVPDIIDNIGNTGESALGPVLMDESVPDDVDREYPNGDSQDMASRLATRADSGSKICGSTRADSAESREKMSHAIVHENSAHPSLSCNARVYSGIDASKEEVTGIMLTNEYYYQGNSLGAVNGENGCESLPEFDPIKHHSSYCPWVNGSVAASCGINTSSGSSSTALSGWQLTVDAIETMQSGQAQNQTVQSDSAASLYKDDHSTPSQKLLRRPSHGKC